MFAARVPASAVRVGQVIEIGGSPARVEDVIRGGGAVGFVTSGPALGCGESSPIDLFVGPLPARFGQPRPRRTAW